MIPTNTASGRRSWRGGGADPWNAVASVIVVSVVALVAGLGCSKTPDGDGDAGPRQPDGQTGPACPFDEIGEADRAAAIEIGEATSGHICPTGDEDWYEFSLSESRRIVDVSLGFSTPLTSVQPAYRIWSTANGETDEAVGSSPSTETDTQLQRQHCLDGGGYKLVVYDRDHDDEDRRRPYSLELGVEENPDGLEPNDSREEAVQLQGGDSEDGYIACRGDQDWYAIEVPDGNVLRFQLESDEVDYQPRVEVLGESGDDEVYASAVNEQAGGEKTRIDRFAVVPEGGTYYLKVSDLDDDDADASTPYTLSVELQSDTDPNEPNDESEMATELTGGGAASCGSGWSRTFESYGTIGDENDQDWFRMPLQGCGDGIVDAEVELDEGDETDEKLELRFRMVRPHEPTTCSSNDECGVIDAECDRGLDCRGLGGVCDQERAYCTGGLQQCLPSGHCGVIQVQREYPCPPDRAQYRDECSSEDLPHRADIGAPLPDTDEVFFQVSDIGFDGADPETRYSILVRVQNEPDPNEPNNLYIGNDTLFDRHASSINHTQAKEVQVFDCTPSQGGDAGDSGMDSGDTSGSSNDTGSGDGLPRGCCANGAAWTEGAISYDNDIDHFKYEHPCPGGDCVMNFHYEIGGGPVDHLFNVTRSLGGGEWIQPAYQCEQANHSRVGRTVSGASLASGQPNLCYYAYEEHGSEEDPHTYGLKIEDDTGEFSDNAFEPSTRDWDPGQTYRFCIEKVADGCPGPPCDKAENGQCNGGGSPIEHCE